MPSIRRGSGKGSGQPESISGAVFAEGDIATQPPPKKKTFWKGELAIGGGDVAGVVAGEMPASFPPEALREQYLLDRQT